MIEKILPKVISASVVGWRKPVHLILHVTSRCNSRCGMCFAWKRLNHGSDLSLEELEKIAQALGGLIFLDLSGGEPFLRNDLAEILSVFEKYSPGAYVNLPTNGLLPEEIAGQTAEILKKTRLPISLNLSLDGLEATHDRIRGVPGNFKRVLATFKRLRELKTKNPRLSVKVSTCVSNQNFSELSALADFVFGKMKGVDFHTLILVRGDPKDKRFALPSLNELEEKKRLFFDIWERYRYGKNLGGVGERAANVSHRYFLNLYLKTLKEKKMVLPCLAGRAHAVVFSNADLAFCELSNPIGNLKKADFDFKKLWFSSTAEKQRKAISQNACFCAHGCNWVDNVFLNPKTYPKLASELLKRGCF